MQKMDTPENSSTIHSILNESKNEPGKIMSSFNQDQSMSGTDTESSTDSEIDKKEATGNKRILVIEDDNDSLDLLVIILEGRDYQVITSQTGQDGYNKTLETIPDLIILDIRLPDISGLDIAKKLKNNDKTKHIPLISITAHAMDSDRETLLNAGFDGYLSKPIFIKEFVKYIEEFI